MIASPFPVYGLRFLARFEQSFALPPYPGGLLRGAFGASLRSLSCMTGFRNCDGCPLLATCPYPAIFAPPPADLTAVGLERRQVGLPPPFVLRIPETGVGTDGRLLFGMRLFGDSIERIAYVIEAWRRALQRGLGRKRIRATLELVTDEGSGATVWKEESEIYHPSPLPPHEIPAGEILLLTRTPLRLQSKGRPLDGEALTPRLLTAAIVRRLRLLSASAGAEVLESVRQWPVDDWLSAAGRIRHKPALRWHDWYRYSARQRQRMNLGGFVGSWTMEGVAPQIAALLSLGNLVHAGKEASFGLGAYALGHPAMENTLFPAERTAAAQ